MEKRVRKKWEFKDVGRANNQTLPNSLTESPSKKINRFVFETISYWQKGLVITLYHRKFITVHLIFHYGLRVSECVLSYGFLIIIKNVFKHKFIYISFAILLTYSRCFQYNENNFWANFFSLSSGLLALMRWQGCHQQASFAVVSYSLSINIFFCIYGTIDFGGL